MKKLFALLLAAVTICSLIACGGESSDHNKMQANESGSQQEVENNQGKENTGSNKESKIVALSIENWTEYFEIITEEGLFSDPMGAKNADIRYSIALKDGVIISQKTWELITFEFSYNLEKRLYTVDENNNIVWEEAETTEAKTDSRELPIGDPGVKAPYSMLSSSTWGKTAEGKAYTVVPVDFVITNVSGNLYFD